MEQDMLAKEVERSEVRPKRRYPIGAEPARNGVSFRVWAPARRSVTVVLEDGSEHALTRAPSGHFSGFLGATTLGARYRFRLDAEDTLYPDLASRSQPDGPHGASEVVGSSAYVWRDAGWSGPRREGQIVYEMHVGTFTRPGSWAAAAERLPRLKELGITMIEMMPIAEFPGLFGWGYDGVDLFAPTRLYGSPDDLRRFVDDAHGLGIAVILDVVYNHLGPDGNFLQAFTPDYFTDRYENDWGEATTSTGRTARACASSSSPMPPTGSTSSTSTGFASMPPRASRMHPTSM
jgi:maltooligosyltrehalose trehalohydrolase